MQKLNIVSTLSRSITALVITLTLSSITSALDATSTLGQTISQASSSAAIDLSTSTTNPIINIISSSSANAQEPFFLKNIEEVKATFLNTDIKEKSIEELIQIEKNKPKRQIEFIDLKFNDNNKKESTDSLGGKSEKLDKKIISKSLKEQKLLLKFKNKNLDEKQKEKLLNKIEKLQKDIYTNSIKFKLQNLKNARKQVNLNRKKNKSENNKIVNDYLSLQSINTDIKNEFDKNLKNNFTVDEKKEIEDIEPDYVYQVDEIYTPNDIQLKNDWAINSIIAENTNTFSTVATLGRPLVVAVIDSGVDYTHEDLVASMWSSSACVNENNVAVVGGCSNGYDFVDNDTNPNASDGSTHGTAVSTLIAASTDNGKGMASLSQNRVKIMALRVADNGYINASNIIRAVYFAVNNNADVINMSLSGPAYSQALFDALKYAQERGVKIIVSAGNQGQDLNVNKVYPASYELANIYTVGSIDDTGAMSSFSNYSPTTVDVVAPGRAVMSGGLGSTYTTYTGTSFSAPLFTAQVVRWLSENKNVDTEIGKLNSGASLVGKVKNGKTLSLSFAVNPAQTQGSVSAPRYTDIGNGYFLDTLAKGGEVVPASQTTGLSGVNDSSIGTPVLYSPGTGSASSPEIINANYTTLRWSSVSGAGVYGVYLTDNDTNTRIIFNNNIGLNTSQYVSGLVAGKTYRWNAASGRNSSSNYNTPAVFYFKVAGANPNPPTPPAVTIPATPSGGDLSYTSSPGKPVSGSQTTLSWNAVSGATYYYVNVRNLNTNALITNQNTNTNSFAYNISASTNYRFDVQACNTAGCSTLAPNGYFYTASSNAAPSVPVITGPTASLKDVSQNYTFKSTDSNSDSVRYEVIWDDAVNNVTQNAGGYVTQNTAVTMSNSFATAKNTCVKARAIDIKGGTSAYSGCYYVNVTAPVANPDLQISQIQTLSGSYSPGSSVSYTFTIKNFGSSQSPVNFKVAAYLGSVYAGSRLGETTFTNALQSGGSEQKTFTFTLPPTGSSLYTGTGNYNLILVVDDTNIVTEQNENNNLSYNNITINIPTTNTFSVDFVNDQTINVNFPVTYTTNIPAGSRIDVSSLDSSASISSVYIDSQKRFVMNFSKVKFGQQLTFTYQGQQVFKTNTFNVASGQVIAAPTSFISYILQDAGKNKLSGVQVEICMIAIIAQSPVDSDDDKCNNAFIKTSNADGIVSLTNVEVSNLIQNVGSHIRFETSNGNVKYGWHVAKNVTSFINTVQVIKTFDQTNNPIILIPGIMGSTEGGNSTLFPYLSQQRGDASTLSIADANAYIGDGSPLRLGWEDIRKELMKYGYVKGDTIIDCPYDWSGSVEYAAKTYFAACVDKAIEIQRRKGKTGQIKVDVIAHSMGGLVTRAYIQQNDGGKNAKNIDRIMFVGTPHLGATDAYSAWEGGDPQDFIRSIILGSTYKAMTGKNLNDIVNQKACDEYKNIAPGISCSDFVGGLGVAIDVKAREMAKHREVKRFLEDKGVYGVKQLLPIYPFIKMNGSGDLVKIINAKNENEFLMALNQYDDCIGLCNDGSVGGGKYSDSNAPYNFISLAQAKSVGGISRMKMFYSDEPKRILTIPTSNIINTKNIVNVTPGPSNGFYEDGVPWASGAYDAGMSMGDGTVPEQSTKGYAEGIPTILEPQALGKIGAHAQQAKIFAKNLADALGNLALYSPNMLQAVEPNVRLNVRVGGDVYTKLTSPDSKSVGVTEGTRETVSTMTNVEEIKTQNNATHITLTDPTSGAYTLTVHGDNEADYSVYVDYADSVTGKKTVKEIYFHKKAGVQTLTFTLNPSASVNDDILKFEDKNFVFPENILVEKASDGKTKVSFTKYTGITVGIVPVKYKLLGKYVNETMYKEIAEIAHADGALIINTLDTFAGSNETLIKQYVLVSVYADGSQSTLSRNFYNNDTDIDGLPDGEELRLGTNVLVKDTDGDGLTDGVEYYIIGTDPLKKDTDANGVEDYEDNRVKFNLIPRNVTPVGSGIIPIAQYKFDGAMASVGKMKDEVRAGVNISEINLVNGIGRKSNADGAYNFNGSNSRGQFITPKILTNSPMTYSFWIKTSQANFARIVSMNANGTRNFFDINVSQGKIHFEIGSNQNLEAMGLKTINDNLWHKVDVTIRNNPNAEIKLYVDGLYDAGLTGTAPFVASNINDKIHLGAANNWMNGAYQSFLLGNLDDLKIYDRVLTIAEILSEYNLDINTIANTAPQLTLNGLENMQIAKNSIWVDPGAVASDVEDGNITNKIIVTGSVNTSLVSTTTLTYSVSDNNFATTTKQRVVIVIDSLVSTTTATTIATITPSVILLEDNFDRSDISVVGNVWNESVDSGDNIKIIANRLVYKWVVQPWGQFHSIYKNITQQNEIKISYKWRVRGGANVDGYLPYVGVRSNGANNESSSYGVGLYYIGQNDTLSMYILDSGNVKVNLANVLVNPVKDTDYNVEVIINAQNHIEARIWLANSNRPISATISFTNGGVNYTPLSTGNNFIILAFHGSSAPYSVETSMDDLKVESIKAVINTAPILTLNGLETMIIYQGSTFTDPRAVAGDAEDGNVTSKITVTGSVNINTVGDYNLVYSVVDNSGLGISKTRIVKVIANPLPTPISHLKFNGLLGNLSKKINSISGTNAVTTEMTVNSSLDRIGASDGGYIFSGNGYITAIAPKILTNNAMTYSFWIKTSSTNPASLFSFTSSGSRNFFSVWLSGGKIYPELAWNNGSHLGINALTANKYISDNKWHKVDVTLQNNPNAEMKSYIDGVLESTTNYNTPYALQNIPNTLTVGAVYNWAMYIYQVHFSGEIDDVRVYDKVLTGSEVLSTYNDDRSSMLSSFGLDGLPIVEAPSEPGIPTPFDSSLLPQEYQAISSSISPQENTILEKVEQKVLEVIKKVDETIEKTVEKVVEQIKEVILIEGESKKAKSEETTNKEIKNIEPVTKTDQK